MTASRLFQIIVRTFIIIFVFSAIWSSVLSKPDIDANYVNNLKISNPTGPGFEKWGKKDFEIAESLVQKANVALVNNQRADAKELILKARFVLSDALNSTTGAKILRIQNALDTLPKLVEALSKTEKIQSKLVKVMPRTNSSYIGHIVDEDEIRYSIQDEGGFIKPELKKNILSLDEITGASKLNYYEKRLKKVIEENGDKNTFGLFTSAKWAYEHNLESQSRELLFKITDIDPNPLETIFESEAKNLLVVGRWSNAVGDFEIAKLKANAVINQFPNTDYEVQAKNLLVDVEKNIVAMQSLSDIHTTNSIATVKLAVNNDRNKKPEEEKIEETVIVPNLAEVNTTEIPEEPKAVNTLKLKSLKTGDINKELEETEELVQKVRDNPRRPEPLKSQVASDPKFIEAMALVKSGKDLTKAGFNYGYIGNKNAQIKFREALVDFEKAVSILSGLEKKYGSDSEYGDLAEQANALKFNLTKNCLHF